MPAWHHPTPLGVCTITSCPGQGDLLLSLAANDGRTDAGMIERHSWRRRVRAVATTRPDAQKTVGADAPPARESQSRLEPSPSPHVSVAEATVLTEDDAAASLALPLRRPRGLSPKDDLPLGSLPSRRVRSLPGCRFPGDSGRSPDEPRPQVSPESIPFQPREPSSPLRRGSAGAAGCVRSSPPGDAAQESVPRLLLAACRWLPAHPLELVCREHRTVSALRGVPGGRRVVSLPRRLSPGRAVQSPSHDYRAICSGFVAERGGVAGRGCGAGLGGEQARRPRGPHARRPACPAQPLVHGLLCRQWTLCTGSRRLKSRHSFLACRSALWTPVKGR